MMLFAWFAMSVQAEEGDVLCEPVPNPAHLGVRWGEGSELLIASGESDLLWILEVSVSVGEVRETFEHEVGLVGAGSTQSVPLALPSSLFDDPHAVNHLAAVTVRARGTTMDGRSGASSRADGAYVAFHEGLAGPPTYYTEEEWPAAVPYGVVHPTPDLQQAMLRLESNGFGPKFRIPAPIRAPFVATPDVAFTGKDAPEHVVLSEDDEEMLEQVRAMSAAARQEVMP